jgi:hypothetical protein
MEIKKSMKEQTFGYGSRRAIIWVLTINLLFCITSIAFSKEGRYKPGFSIKLTYGTNRYSWGDINECLESFNNNELFEYMRSYFPELISGEIIKLDNFASDWEAELRIDITRRFALSLAISETIIRKNESSLTYIDRHLIGDQISAWTYKPEVKVSTPVKLGIYYTLPFGSKININFNAGIGCYSAKVSEYMRHEVTFISGESEWTVLDWETYPKTVCGFHGGIGLEYSLMKNFALVVEVQRRNVKLKDLKGIWQYEGKHSEGVHEEKGTLYYYNMWDLRLGTRYDNLKVWERPPDFSIWDMRDIRKAVLDLTGYSFRMGIRIRLF